MKLLHYFSKHTTLFAFILTLALASSATWSDEPGDLQPQEFKRLHKSLFSEAAQQAWRKIGWHASVAEAIDRAKKEDKALLLWVSYGPPLTCG